MIGGIGQNGGLARAAIEAALKSQTKSAQAIDAKVDASFQAVEARAAEPGRSTGAANPAQEVIDGLNESIQQVDRLPLELAGGGISDFSQLAAQLKQSELTFKFALEVRNKLIDAYRETMRMSV